MVSDWDELDQNDELDELIIAKEKIDKIFIDVWNTPAGQRMFEYLKERYLDVPTARLGDTVQDTFYRQGKADLVRDMIGVINGLNNPN